MIDINKLLEKETIKYRFKWTRRIDTSLGRKMVQYSLFLTIKHFIIVCNDLNESRRSRETRIEVHLMDSISAFECSNNKSEGDWENTIYVYFVGGSEKNANFSVLPFSDDEAGEKTLEMVANALLSLI